MIQVDRSEAARLVAAFPAERFYMPPEEVVLVELARTVGGHLNVIALESMTKADFFRDGGGEKHLRDIRGMLDVSGDRIDAEAITAACGSLGLAAEWARARGR